MRGRGNALAAAKFLLTPQRSKLWPRCHIGPDVARPAQRVEDPPRPAEMAPNVTLYLCDVVPTQSPADTKIEIAAEEQMGGCHILR